MTLSNPSSTPHVALVILNWNGCSDTLECLESLQASSWPHTTVYVADNGSNDDSVARIQASYPHCRLLELGQNFGFAEGNNLGVQTALHEGADLIILLNNDTIVAADFVKNLVKAYQKLGPNVALGAKIGYYGERETVWDFGSLWDDQRGSYHKVARGQPMDSLKEVVEVDHIIGCAMMIPSSIIRQLGLFDRRYFLNFEETDWCVRAKRLGVRLFSIPDARVWHKISKSFVGGLHNQYFVSRNRGLWLQNFPLSKRIVWFWSCGRFKSNLSLAVKTALRLITLPLWMPFKSRRPKHTYRLAYAGIRLMGWMHHLMGRYGDCPDWVRGCSRYFKKRD